MNDLGVLLDIPLFSELDREDLGLLQRVMEVRTHPKGFRFLEEGKRAGSIYTGMFVLLDGMVRVSATRPDGGYAVDKPMGMGSVFGMVALIDDGPRSASVEALTPCTVAFLGKTGFETLYASGMPVAARFQRLLAKQMVSDLRYLGGLLQEAIHGDDSALVSAVTSTAVVNDAD
jgi:CRP-like cAMP-binding protein